LGKRCDRVLAGQVATLAQHYTVLRSSERVDATLTKVSTMRMLFELEFNEEAIAAAAEKEAGTGPPVVSARVGSAEAEAERERVLCATNSTTPPALKSTTDDRSFRIEV
jgi:hypothetical protein